MSELQNETRIKSFEAERTQMVYEETVRTLKETQLESEKAQKKLEVFAALQNYLFKKNSTQYP